MRQAESRALEFRPEEGLAGCVGEDFSGVRWRAKFDLVGIGAEVCVDVLTELYVCAVLGCAGQRDDGMYLVVGARAASTRLWWCAGLWTLSENCTSGR